LVSAFWGNPGAASLIIGCSGSPSTSNKIIQKGLAFSRRQSGTVSGSGRCLRFGILPSFNQLGPCGYFDWSRRRAKVRRLLTAALRV
jgi:hypothetical protein